MYFIVQSSLCDAFEKKLYTAVVRHDKTKRRMRTTIGNNPSVDAFLISEKL